MPPPFGFTLLSLCFALVLALISTASALDLYVSTDGSDTATGRASTALPGGPGPFATFERARDEIRSLKKQGALAEPVTVYVRGGVYELSRTLVFGPEDSGTDRSPVVYRAYQNEKPVLSGGSVVKGFAIYKGGILKADLAAQGLKGVYFRQLFFEGKRQPLARYPNADPKDPIAGGWLYVEGKPVSLYSSMLGADKVTVAVRKEDWRAWSHPEEAEVFIYPCANYWNNILPIRSLNPETRKITLGAAASYQIRPGDRFFVQNLMEELDAPGEWYLDKATWTLYFWPPESFEGKAVVVPRLATILQLNPGTTDLVFCGLTIEHATGTAVILNKAERCLIAGDTICNSGDYEGNGVAVQGGSHNGVVGNDIYEIGRSAITLSGGDVPTLTPSGHYAENNYIHHFGIYYKEGSGIELMGVGSRASHNLIHDGPRFGIFFDGNNHMIEFNHIRHVALETEDVGGIYCGGRNWISPRGSAIRYNFIHDVIGFAHLVESGTTRWIANRYSWGIYLDDNSGGVDVIGNIVARCGRATFIGHNSRDCVIENNIFVDGGTQQWELNGWPKNESAWMTHFPTMLKGYESVAGQPAWKKMRGMELHPKDAPDAKGWTMRGNVMTKNIFAWSNPQARAMAYRFFNPERNPVDWNLYWNNGHPIVTLEKPHTGKTLGTNLVPNPSFAKGAPHELPEGWTWNVRPRPDALAEVVMDGTNRCLRIDAARIAVPKEIVPSVQSAEIPLTPGASYRLRASLRSDNPGGAKFMVYCPLDPTGKNKWAIWVTHPYEVKVGANWKETEIVFTLPAPGQKEWRDTMGKYHVRFDWPAEHGSLFARDVKLEQVERLDLWKSWQETGPDRHSIVADPLFRNAAADDYRLDPKSPAWALGFKPIPVEKIGPYADELRASWPIKEASGFRENAQNK